MKIRALGRIFITLSLCLKASAAEAPKPGDTFNLGSRTVAVKQVDALPYLESEYSRLFHFDAFENPKLKELRERYKLDEVVAAGKDEFDKQVLLMDWVHHRFKKFGRPSINTRGAQDILNGIDEGHSFFCTHYAELFVSSAASLGWVDRPLALRRHQDAGRSGASEHTTTEMWSNQHRKWIMMDPTAHMFIEKNGVPLNAFEIRQEWFYQGGTNLVFVVGKERKTYRKPDLPIFLGRFPGFGDLTVPVDELDKYGFTAYIPNTNLMDEREDYGKMFIVKDAVCDGTRWHTRKVPRNPAVDPYFPIGQAAFSLTVGNGNSNLKVTLQTLTPNFKEYQARIDWGNWKTCSDILNWAVHSGVNRLELRTVNHFGVAGPVSVLELE